MQVLRRKVLESAAIETCQIMNLWPGYFLIPPLLKKLGQSQARITNIQKIQTKKKRKEKKLKENGWSHKLMFSNHITHKSIPI